VEVTVGRVPIEEINFRMMESKQVSGLRLSGELPRYDRRIGGFDISLDLGTGSLTGRTVSCAL